MTVVGLHPEDLFDKMFDGELLPIERERLQAHLEGCQVCRFEYAARLDFQEEALALSAASSPPALPLRPLPLIDAPTSASPELARAPRPPVRARRRRSRRLVWGLAAAALISASGAVASSLAGRSTWSTVASMFSRSAAPAERAAPAVVKPARAGRASAPPAVLDALLVDATPAETPTPQAAFTRQRDARHALEAGSRRAGAHGSRPSVARTTKSEAPSAKDDAAAKDTPTKEPLSAAKLFGEANQARRAGDVGRASGLYHLLQDQFPGSAEADLSRVTLALLLLDSGDAQGALSGFERYLAGSSRGLEAEALVGRARALGRLGRHDLEATAWREVQRKYPRSLYGRQAGERLLALGQP